MLTDLWYSYLFDPLFNGLMLLYNTVAHENLGLAVVYLTIGIRLVLLPFSIISIFAFCVFGSGECLDGCGYVQNSLPYK